MSKPDDISHEVWNAAEAAFDLMLCNCIEASGTTEQLRLDSIEPLARAILAERERCAKLVEEGFDREVGEPYAAGKRSKNDKCPHGRYMYEDCEPCCAAAIRAGGQ